MKYSGILEQKVIELSRLETISSEAKPQNTTTSKALQSAMLPILFALGFSTTAILHLFTDSALAWAPILLVGVALIYELSTKHNLWPKTLIEHYLFIVIILSSTLPTFGTTGTLLRLVSMLFGLALLASVLVSKKWRPIYPGRHLVWSAGILCTILIMYAMAGDAHSYSLTRLINWLGFVPALALASQVRHPQRVVFAFLINGVIQLSGILLQKIGTLGGTWGGIVTAGDGYTSGSSQWLTRYTGFIQNPNDLALLLVLSLVSTYLVIRSSERKRAKILLLVLGLAFLWGILETGSRGGLLGVFICIVTLALSTLSGTKRVLLIISLPLITICIFMLAMSSSNPVLKSLVDVVEGTDPSSVNRNIIWERRTANLELSDYVIGTGYGGYSPEFTFNTSSNINQQEFLKANTVDNSWIKALLELGILGLICIATILFVPIKRLIQNNSLVSRVLLTMLFVILWRSISVDLMDISPWNQILMILLGLALVSPISTKNSFDGLQKN